MDVKLHQWLAVTIWHEYFDKKECPVFELKAIGSTARMMKNYDVSIRKYSNQFHAYAGVKDTKNLWDELKGIDDLYFQMINTDVYFNSYTSLSKEKLSEDLLYITNPKVENRFQSSGLLEPEEYVVSKGLQFTIEVIADKNQKIQLKNSEGDWVYESNSPINQANCLINLKGYITGIYELWIDEKKVHKLFVTNESIDQNCYGILHIQMAKIIVSLKENTIPAIEINFETKSTFWQYAIVIPEDKKITIQELKIEDTQQNKYVNEEEKQLAGGITAQIYTAPEAVKLKQNVNKNPILKLQYSNEFSDTVIELDKKMPTPQVSNIITKKKDNAENAYYSQTIVYV